jgi:hypothetical protein
MQEWAMVRQAADEGPSLDLLGVYWIGRLNRHHHNTGDCKAKGAIRNETTAVEVAATSQVSSAVDTVASCR